MIINVFQNVFSPLPKKPQEWLEEQKQTNQKPTENSVKEISQLVNEKGKREFFQKHFSFSMLSAMLRDLFRANDKRKNRELVDLIKSELRDLK